MVTTLACGGKFAAMFHTSLKWLIAGMVQAVAADPLSSVTEVMVERDGMVKHIYER